MKPQARSPLAALAAGLLLLGSAGCRNPFDPEADLRMWRIDACGGGPVVQILQSDALVGAMTNTCLQRVIATVLNYSSVQASLTSYSVVYRQISAQTGACPQPPGSPICSLGGAGGRKFAIREHVDALTNNASENTQTDVWMMVLTPEVLTYIGTNTSTIGGGIDMDITLFGTDHNGHDVKVGGTIHIEVY